ncbi:MAG: bifunctional phosphopantothenoylcysteine decarboxylase/phosphopantothenate--cysteine ligase CoaBC, partial [Polyangiales bacterium]
PSSLAGKSVALCVTGGIAAYKAVIVARLLVQAGARVVPVMTASASRFVGKVTFSGVCGRGVHDDMWDPKFAGEAHVAIADEVDLIAVVPATADSITRFAQGRADDLVAALVLVARTPVVIAPAMHPRMWSHPATQRNVDTLSRDGRVRFVGPVEGVVANGDVGVGRMSEPDEIVAALARALAGRPRDLEGKHVVVTAGPTVEDLDPVRFLGNRSTGKMGFSCAAAAFDRGARVTLIAGPVALPTPVGVTRVDVRSALEMQAVIDEAIGFDLDRADTLIMAAAVADYRPTVREAEKSKKPRGVAGERKTVELVRNPDLLAAIGARRVGARPVLVGFAVETENLADYAAQKLHDKRVDLVVANLASHGFAGDRDEGLFVDASGAAPFAGTKRDVADAILDRVRDRLA